MLKDGKVKVASVDPLDDSMFAETAITAALSKYDTDKYRIVGGCYEKNKCMVNIFDKVKAYKENYQDSVDSDPQDTSQEKVIQITVGTEGIPSIRYNGSTLSIAEVIGTLEMSKDILMKKTIDNTLLQQNIYNMLQGLAT